MYTFILSILLKIHRKGSHWLHQFHILAACSGESDQQIASIRQKFTFLKHSYEIYSIYGFYKLKGFDMFDHSFKLKNEHGETVATVNKEFFSIADVYDVEISGSNDDKIRKEHAFILALVVTLHCSLYCSW